MASTAEKTFGSRIANAQKLATFLADFPGYTPVSPDYSIAALQTDIDDLSTTNANIVTATTLFTTTTEARQQLFMEAPDSMLRRLTAILAYIKALYGKDSTEADMIGKLVTKTRGEKTAKFKRDEEGEWVSQSQRSYGSMTQHFADIIGILTTFGAAYAPPQDAIKLPMLNALLALLTDSTNNVNAAYVALKTKKDSRIARYQDLSNKSMRIKDAVKAQYGITSTEHKLIKGLNI